MVEAWLDFGACTWFDRLVFVRIHVVVWWDELERMHFFAVANFVVSFSPLKNLEAFQSSAL